MSFNLSVAIENVKKSTYPISSGNTLYVGGSGEGNYSSIQDAIDDAVDGDTVFVYEGIYNESGIKIEKSINLTGENRDKTIIQGYNEGHDYYEIIRLKTNWINISGFTFENLHRIQKSIRIDTKDFKPSFDTITNNIFICNGECAISTSMSYRNSITDNIIMNQGLIAIGGDSTTILNNTFIDSYGILIRTENNIVENNTIDGKPIYYYYNKKNIIVPSDASQVILVRCNNIIIENITSINTAKGIYLRYSSNNTIRNNILTESIKSGIELRDSFQNNISNNVIDDNGEMGLYIDIGCNKNIVSKNIIANNSRYGIWSFGEQSVISENKIVNNEYGIRLDRDGGYITSNIIYNNIFGGIIVDSSDLYWIKNNTLINNNKYGILLAYSDYIDYFGESVRTTSDNNIISGNFVNGHQNGILISLECNNNRIYRNHVFNNTYGIFLRVNDGNDIFENNLINNSKNAFFQTFRFFKFKFHHNYWDDCIDEKIKIITGRNALFRYYTLFGGHRYYWFFIPWLSIDWHPAQEPYDIEV